MSKSNNLSQSLRPGNVAVALNSGRVGNVRYYTKSGKTYTRTVSRQGGVTRTMKQMAVRCRIANIKSMYDALSRYLKMCFEGADANVSVFNRFFSLASKCTPIYLTKEQKMQGFCIAAPYAISQGTLPTIAYALNAGGILQSSIKVGSLSITSATTVGELAAAIVGNNPAIDYNDFISFIAVKQLANGGQQYVDVKGYNIQLIEGSAELLSEKAEDGFAVQGGFLAMSAVPEVGCYGWIHSRRSNGVKVSSQYLFNANQTKVTVYGSDTALNEAAHSYGEIDSDPFVTSDEGDEPAPSHALSLSATGAGAGNAVFRVRGNDYVGSYYGHIHEGESVVVIAKVDSEGQSAYKFGQWSDGLTTAQRTIVMGAEDITLSASFIERPPVPRHSISLSATGAGASTAEFVVNGTTHSGSFSAQFDEGESVVVKAQVSAAGQDSYQFEKWSDNVMTAERTIMVGSSDITLSASIIERQTSTPKLMLRVSNPYDSDVTMTVNGQQVTVVYGTGVDLEFGQGTSINIVAPEQVSDAAFESWIPASYGTNREISFSMPAVDTELRATYSNM